MRGITVKYYTTQVDILTANKGDGVEFLQQKLNIPDKEITFIPLPEIRDFDPPARGG